LTSEVDFGKRERGCDLVEEVDLGRKVGSAVDLGRSDGGVLADDLKISSDKTEVVLDSGKKLGGCDVLCASLAVGVTLAVFIVATELLGNTATTKWDVARGRSVSDTITVLL
jgi:hypothetical protein